MKRTNDSGRTNNDSASNILDLGQSKSVKSKFCVTTCKNDSGPSKLLDQEKCILWLLQLHAFYYYYHFVLFLIISVKNDVIKHDSIFQ